MIDNETRLRILEAANILEVVSDFVSLKRSGVNYKGLCPFHSDRTPSFHVSPSKNYCKCFACGEGGSPLHFIMKHEQLSYHDALRYLAKKYGIEIVERELTSEERQAADLRQSLLVVNDYAAQFFAHELHETAEGQTVALSYFRERGLLPETIKKFGLGYSPERRDALTAKALSAGYALEHLVATGLSLQYEDKPAVDRFRGRVIFPIRNLSGQYVGFGGRIMGKADKTAKYVNSPDSVVYSKSRELYGLYWAKQAISRADKCYLVEGYTDVISMHQAGIENVVASSGTALTTQQIRLLRRFTEHVTVLYDGDSAGIKAALRGIDLLLEEGLIIKVVLLPEGEDPDSYARRHTAEELLRFLDAEETDFIHFKIRLYQEEMRRDPIKRAELIRDILRSIALIPDTIRRSVLVQSVSAELKMDEAMLSSEVVKIRQQATRSHQYEPLPTPEPTPRPTPEPRPWSGNHQYTATETPTTSVGGATPTPTAPQTDSYEPFRHELPLLRLLMQSGQTELLAYVETEETKGYEPHILADYVYSEIDLDGIFDDLSPVCRDLLLETKAYTERGQVDTATHFLNHESEAIRRLAADLLSEDMKLGTHTDEAEDIKLKKLTEKLESLPPEQADERAALQLQIEKHHETLRHRDEVQLGQRVLWELDQIRMAVILKSIAETQAEIAIAEREGNTERLLELLRYLQEDNEIKQSLAQSLGERTVRF